MDCKETQLALNVVLSTAASMGIDVDLLCHAAAEELLDGDFPDSEKQLAAGAIFVIGVALGNVVDPQ
ncbi:hypothetical protein [Pseudomonas syringae]|uniref:hypothetical protein n=1 Tax=Pseudomonas syringae TaxID=317 RepID=UPI000647E446|nr:hypothetical protein [Pseudomonas syringae]